MLTQYLRINAQRRQAECGLPQEEQQRKYRRNERERLPENNVGAHRIGTPSSLLTNPSDCSNIVDG